MSWKQIFGWIGVLFGVIATAVVGDLVTKGLEDVQLRNIWDSIVAVITYAVPIYWWIAAPIVGFLGWLSWRWWKRDDHPAFNYTSDTIEGMVWHWTYGPERQIQLQAPRCPKCKFELRHERMMQNLLAFPATEFWCDECQDFKHLAQGDFFDMEDKVRRAVEHRIRTNLDPDF